ncbi:PD40 domain-containing protein [Shewanella oneidensis MR-1]|uniref:Bifunctional TolB-family protein/amidohydrolase n=1 Tax=Shewanella oneidensis (strain ATCC 700550 / JCM 31522 / CIP 106686 / LMG 19005 / NCIMB 14063 / MR-1) TaxID=211586 RepID=Q8EKS3_SHEON|nr:amidohydrolase family protein [Shewanella oneidensis]AAN53104.2 bifunctional TolB-family protein/amidohydrolase [Shewanella oneidensis MR-1]MDX5997993.1 amidohydrolase family protein [Shewanella oneidensis]MEE2027697.1 Tol-Pal system protein TolB [Shewanella oneidensis]QKG95006.1 PD40 domain-containing protein [Shewanella oneidensis MR-1]
MFRPTLTPLYIALMLSLNPPIAHADEVQKPSWDVNAPTNAPLKKVKIDVNEGTWMNLSVSPDGQHLVFDLLGDIYQIPVTGGEAKPLAQGISWQMQPVYSPNGKHIAFTSDADGGDNIWIMNADGSNPRTVTSETFRLLNSPAWSPDSQYLIGRKHFTASRSLGAGEVWLYHVAGGEGVKLTERPNDEKDLGEPAYSPDGRYIYFSQDDTPGKTFHYSKDSVNGIYKIKRYDTKTGNIEILIEGTGGAIRPTPSPDGTKLAYIKRDDFQSSLYLLDLKSGETTKLFGDLDRDMQETWAIHGVYPSMAWTQDNKDIFFWAKGKINRLNVANKTVTNVPFSVKTQLDVQPSVRFKQDIDKDVFDVKMLRMAQVSPDGSKVAFEALGKIWLKSLPDGKMSRLTELGNDIGELYPQWSRDGKNIVFTTWNDQDQGAVQVISAKGGKAKQLTTEPGKYVEPTFAPNGELVVYRKTQGGNLTPRTWSQEPGIYKVDLKTKQNTKITAEGYQAQFGASAERIFFMNSGDDDTPQLASINLDGFDKRVHYSSKHATEFRVSPDGEQLAFAERFKVWVTPFAKHGETVEIGPNASNLPVTQLSVRAGESISWNSKSNQLYWTLGPELYQTEVDSQYLKKDEQAKPSIINLGFTEKADVPRGTVAFVGGKVITMENDQVIDKGVVIVKDNHIVAVGDANTPIPKDAQVIDISSKSIMPGLFDAHAHGAQADDEIVPQQNWALYSGLSLGVTTIHDPSNDTTEIFAASEQQKAGNIVGPRIFSTGTILYGANAPGYTSHIDSVDDAKFHLERLKKVGAFSVKSYNQPRRNQRQQVIAAARELEMMVVPEGGSLLQHNLTMVADGHTTVEHSLPVASIYNDIKQFWGQTKVGYTPTLVVAYGGISGENYWYDKTDVWAHPRLSMYVPSDILQARSMRRPHVPESHYNHFNVAKVANEFNKLGIHPNIGAHGQREGLAAHWEMWMFAQGGMSNMDVLKTATINPATTFGLDHQLGSIKTGKLADLIVIDGDPLADIRVTDRVTYTMVNGKLFDAESMNQLNGNKQQRKPFFFEKI